MIRVAGLSKSYGPHLAVHDLTFHADRGEVLGFLGPNGAGKTTTMRILAGFMPPTAGSARVAGFDVVEQSLEVRRRVGYLPETVPLYPEMSVREYLTFMGSLRRVAGLAERIEAVLEEVGLSERTESTIGNLSKGLRQRLGLAQALLHQPEVLILDEPTIGLDPGQIIEVRRIIQNLGTQRTVLLSTHILSEAQQMCDRVLIINRGVIVAEDTPGNLQAQLAGAERFRVAASVDGEELRQLVLAVTGVTAVRFSGGQGEVEVSGTPGQDLRPAVARRIVEAGHDLYALTPTGLSLEEVFLQLTREETQAREAT
ncbi:MAG: ABC transporter ATP-binding protein [Anaerolineales bacterium]|nr:ABC transporter ATP-binding protein [Anaerolineales bacterium]